MLFEERIMPFVPSTDLARSREFYEGVLGLTVEDAHDFALEVRGHDRTILRITKVAELTPHPFTVLGWRVSDLPATLRDLVASGVEPLRFDGMGQDADGVWTAPGGTKVVWFHDPDHNVLSISD
jgi:catechol 2,3-dioxygenase-like lactoylglutathione lyase family enzyme